MNPIAQMVLNIMTKARAAKKASQPTASPEGGMVDAKGANPTSPPYVIPREVQPVKKVIAEPTKTPFEPVYQSPPYNPNASTPFNMVQLQNSVDNGGMDLMKLLQLMKRR